MSGILGLEGRELPEWKENHPSCLETTLQWKEILLLPDTLRTVCCGSDVRGGVPQEAEEADVQCLGLPGEVGCQRNPRGCRSLPPLGPPLPQPRAGNSPVSLVLGR